MLIHILLQEGLLENLSQVKNSVAEDYGMKLKGVFLLLLYFIY